MSVLKFCLRLFALAGTAFLPGYAWADVFTITYQMARVESITAASVGLNEPGSILGTETFNELKRGGFMSVPSFRTTFGTNDVLAGIYSGGMGIYGADQYGGAGNIGNYLVTFGNTDGYRLDLLHDRSVPGYNYFGLQLSALDAGNRLDFLRAGQTVFSYTPAVLISSLGRCGGSNAYCGNPTTGANNQEQYAFVSFLDRDSTFDQIWFRQSGSGGLETDNHTVGYKAPDSFSTIAATLDVSEPSTVALLGTGLLAFGLIAARKARNPG